MTEAQVTILLADIKISISTGITLLPKIGASYLHSFSALRKNKPHIFISLQVGLSVVTSIAFLTDTVL